MPTPTGKRRRGFKGDFTAEKNNSPETPILFACVFATVLFNFAKNRADARFCLEIRRILCYNVTQRR